MKITIRRACVLLACIILALTASACGKSSLRAAYMDFCRAGYDGEIIWTANDRTYIGHLTLTAGDEPAAREARLTYSAPAALKGVTAHRKDGRITLTLDGVKHDIQGDADGHFAMLRFFSPALAATAQEDDSHKLRMSDAEGDYTVQLDKDGRVCELLFTSPSLSLRLLPGGAA
ncbi:MAG: hypothetical protein IJY20_03510 [Clostridia bacterium]|nr:hypothetical protein [Clostridia bacterium]